MIYESKIAGPIPLASARFTGSPLFLANNVLYTCTWKRIVLGQENEHSTTFAYLHLHKGNWMDCCDCPPLMAFFLCQGC